MLKRRQWKIAKDDSYLDLIPIRRSDCLWQELESGHVEIRIPRQSVLDRLVRRFKKTPDYMAVELDEIGSTAWRAMDGSQSVGDIAETLAQRHDADAGAMYLRLGTFLNILRNNRLVQLEKP